MSDGAIKFAICWKWHVVVPVVKFTRTHKIHIIYTLIPSSRLLKKSSIPWYIVKVHWQSKRRESFCKDWNDTVLYAYRAIKIATYRSCHKKCEVNIRAILYVHVLFWKILYPEPCEIRVNKLRRKISEDGRCEFTAPAVFIVKLDYCALYIKPHVYGLLPQAQKFVSARFPIKSSKTIQNFWTNSIGPCGSLRIGRISGGAEFRGSNDPVLPPAKIL